MADAAVSVRVLSHFRALRPTAALSYPDRVAALIASTFAGEPLVDVIRACFRQPCLGAPHDDREEILRRLDQVEGLPAEAVTRAALERLVALVPPSTAAVDCHLYPGRAPDRGGGMSFGPGRVLIGVPVSDDWAIRVARNCAHEYSHAVRMGLFPGEDSVLNALIGEGLAETLADELYPAPELRSAPASDAWLADRWRALAPHLRRRGMPAYLAHVAGTPGAYALGEALVRRYLAARRLTSVSQQRVPADAVARWIRRHRP